MKSSNNEVTPKVALNQKAMEEIWKEIRGLKDIDQEKKGLALFSIIDLGDEKGSTRS